VVNAEIFKSVDQVTACLRSRQAKSKKSEEQIKPILKTPPSPAGMSWISFKEEAMLNRMLLCALFAIFVAGAANAQQREAALQKVELANAGFNIVIATAKLNGATADFRKELDPNLVYLADGELVYAYTGRLEDLSDMGILAVPACTFHVERRDFSPRTPVVIYVIPKGEIPLAIMTK
jgi:hypothetical protein